MSYIYEYENQMIIRFPKEIAQKIRDQMNKGLNQPMNIIPFAETTQAQVPSSLNPDDPQIIRNTTQMKFDINIPSINYKATGNLVELPTITESYKSKDYINLFKSNDINQMIWIEGKDPQDKMFGVRKIYEPPQQSNQCYTTKIVCDHGLTPPTFDVRRDCHRKQPYIPQDEIQIIENELDDIQEQQMQQAQNRSGYDSGMDQDSGAEKLKRRRRKKEMLLLQL